MKIKLTDSYIHEEYGVVRVEWIDRRVEVAEAEPGDDSGRVVDEQLIVQFSYSSDGETEHPDTLADGRVEQRGIEELTTFVEHTTNE